ncbi:MAG: MFS transporter [Chitinophagales bacterium]|nr:MAG: MFS transporter [Chitinophagales bacterium]
MSKAILSRTVWILSIISLFNDLASEMLYPVMPVYLQSVGFSVFIIGLLEGFAEAAAGLSKGYFGYLSDRTSKRLIFIRTGYALSALSKPLFALWANVWWIFLLRTSDRLGKGLRTAARDALLSSESTPASKGQVFGFHRSMDTAGAFLGPLLALLFLYFFPGNYTLLFLLAFFPGVAVILLTFLLRESPHEDRQQKQTPKQAYPSSVFAFFGYWSKAPAPYRHLLSGLVLFLLFNSSDFFLLMKVKEAGFSDTYVVGSYIFYNLVYALAAYPLGMLADKAGLKTVFLTGLALFAITYSGFAFADTIHAFVLLLLLYGLFAAATEGIIKAWISNLVPSDETATALGTFAAFQSICALIASSLTGLLWMCFGAATAFLTTSSAAVVSLLYLAMKMQNPPK